MALYIQYDDVMVINAIISLLQPCKPAVLTCIGTGVVSSIRVARGCFVNRYIGYHIIILKYGIFSSWILLCIQAFGCRVVSCRVVSCRVVSCRVVSCRVVSCRVVSCRAVPCAVPCRAVPCRAVPCRAVPCRVVSCRAVP